jgi:hypothetical protein
LPGDRAILGLSRGNNGFTFTFPSGFTIVWFDSAGDPNADERQLAGELAPVDVAIFPWTPHPISETHSPIRSYFGQDSTCPIIMTASGPSVDNGLAPLFMKIRDHLPATKFAEPLYRSAIASILVLSREAAELPDSRCSDRRCGPERTANSNQESQNQQLTFTDNPLPFGCG